MKSVYLIVVGLALMGSACGGLRHIPDVASETQWRALTAISPTKAAATLACIVFRNFYNIWNKVISFWIG